LDVSVSLCKLPLLLLPLLLLCKPLLLVLLRG
jgi:hypothetical protein